MEGDVMFSELLMRSKYRAPFLEGVYGNEFAKASFKCGHLAEQLKQCGRGVDSKGLHELDSKVCDVLRWEQILCWSRWVAAPQFSEVQKCYGETQPRDRARCDPSVLELREKVERVRAGTNWESLLASTEPAVRDAVEKCPDIASITNEGLANSAMSCVTRRISSDVYRSFTNCLKSAKEEPEKCLEIPAHLALMRQLGVAYGLSKSKESLH